MYENIPHIDVTETGKRIEQLRCENHLSRKDLQEFFGFTSIQAIYKWERGKCAPSLDNIWGLSILFDTKIEDILRSDNSKERGEEKTSPLPIWEFLLNYRFIEKGQPAWNNYIDNQ